MEQKILENILMEKNAPFFLCGMTLLPGFSNANCDRKKMGKKVYWYKKKAYF